MVLANLIKVLPYREKITLYCSSYKKAPYGEYQFSPAKKEAKYDIIPQEIPNDILLMEVMGINARGYGDLVVYVAEWI